MAKDNLFLGFGRGKIGDVVFYRRNGQQISRARNRSPRNPNTFRQQLQRAVSANVQRLYSAGMEVFNHSFEGRTVGEGNQQEFVHQNMKLLRNLLVSDYNLGRSDSECTGRIGAPGLTIPVPFDGMCISNGSIQQQLFSWDSVDGFSMPDPLRDDQDAISETVGAYARRVGLVPDDIYTFVAFGCDPLEGSELAYFGDLETFNNYAAVFSQLFGFAQLRVLPGVLDDQSAITSSTTLASFFMPAERGTDISGTNLVSPITTQIIDERMVDGMIGCIRSREDSGVRSPSFMHVQRALYDYGLTINYLSAAWSRSVGVAGSDLLLEGSEFVPSSGQTDVFPYPGGGSPATHYLQGIRTITGKIVVNEQQVNSPIVVAFDEEGTNYIIKCVDLETRWYGKWLVNKDGYGYVGTPSSGLQEAWATVAVPDPETAPDMQISFTDYGTAFYEWLIRKGCSPTIWVATP